MSINVDTAQALGYAMKYGKPVSFEGTAATGRFVISGGYYALPDEIDDLAAMAARVGFKFDPDDLKEMIPAADWHPLGRVIETRSRLVESYGFLGTGAGTFTAHEALVELADEWTDMRGEFCETHPAGARVWVKA